MRVRISGCRLIVLWERRAGLRFWGFFVGQGFPVVGGVGVESIFAAFLRRGIQGRYHVRFGKALH